MSVTQTPERPASQQAQEETNGALVRHEQQAPALRRASVVSLQPQSFAELCTFAQMIERSTFIPKEYIGKAGDIVACIQYGAELGLPALQSLQSICVINGKPSVYGDTMLALVRVAADGQGRKLLEAFDEGTISDSSGNLKGAWCESKRAGWPRRRTEFTLEDAKKASLLDKPGPWKQYPQRMLMFRARAFNLRDNFGDVLKGLRSVEEVIDYEVSAFDQEEQQERVRGVEALKRKLQGLPAAPTAESQQAKVDAAKKLQATALLFEVPCNSKEQVAEIVTMALQLDQAVTYGQVTAEQIDQAEARLREIQEESAKEAQSKPVAPSTPEPPDLTLETPNANQSLQDDFLRAVKAAGHAATPTGISVAMNAAVKAKRLTGGEWLTTPYFDWSDSQLEQAISALAGEGVPPDLL